VVVGILIEGLLDATLVRPAIPGLHLATDLALVEVVTIIPLLLNEGNIQDLYLLRIEGTVEKDHSIAERGHTHALHRKMGTREAVVRVQ
jgi:hypothetical protein